MAVDKKQIDRMRENLGEDFSAFLEAYLDGTQQSLDAMTPADQNGDIETLQRLAHSIKSSSLNAGAMHLSDMAKSVEFEAKEDRLADASKRIAALQKEFDLVRKALSDV